jgi:hypothetical protein
VLLPLAHHLSHERPDKKKPRNLSRAFQHSFVLVRFRPRYTLIRYSPDEALSRSVIGISADVLLLNLSKAQLDNVEKDHYLFEFTNEELYEITEKPDEWGEFDFLLAMKILSDRGLPVNHAKIIKSKQDRVETLSKKAAWDRAYGKWAIASMVIMLVASWIFRKFILSLF